MFRLFVAAVPVLLAAQTPATPDPRELVRQSADAIKHYKSYELESVVLVETKGGALDNRMEIPTAISVRRPDRMLIESRSTVAGVTIAGDGEHTWYYLTPEKKYIKRAAAGSPEAALGDSGLLPKNLPDVSKSIRSVELAREEEIELDGGKRFPCWVVETAYDPITLPEQDTKIVEATEVVWISKEQGLRLQSTFHAKLLFPGKTEPVEMTQSTRTTALRLNVDLPDSLFVFTPPPDAKQTADWSLPGITKPDVLAKPAPDFKAQTLDGAKIDLAALRGKVVLLDFWATWCVPCKRDLPAVEKMHREFRQSGLAVLGINVGEEKAEVQKFLSTLRLTHPVVQVDEASDLVTRLAVNAFPTTVLIDRKGNVAAYEVGVRGEAALRADLAKLGIGTPPARPGPVQPGKSAPQPQTKNSK
jgi:thiol-disulfide isomerase/thioredoxin